MSWNVYSATKGTGPRFALVSRSQNRSRTVEYESTRGLWVEHSFSHCLPEPKIAPLNTVNLAQFEAMNPSVTSKINTAWGSDEGTEMRLH